MAELRKRETVPAEPPVDVEAAAWRAELDKELAVVARANAAWLAEAVEARRAGIDSRTVAGPAWGENAARRARELLDNLPPGVAYPAADLNELNVWEFRYL